MDTPKTQISVYPNGDPPEIDSAEKATVSQSGELTHERDAAKRGGPKTQKGKENSKHNALRHGIFSHKSFC